MFAAWRLKRSCKSAQPTLIPIARRFKVFLLGTGMPSFYLADLGEMTFTLGLSGWTANDWSTAGNFDLLAPRADVDSETQRRVFGALKENWLESPASLAARLDLDRSVVLGALSVYTQAWSRDLGSESECLSRARVKPRPVANG